ncbi:hypothetical protein [Thalassobellus citreus]|uniref:hypothetical protein n=1 Tax=Thalassobellus citreus TaxID=3367752 RepID=UPI0037B8E3B4
MKNIFENLKKWWWVFPLLALVISLTLVIWKKLKKKPQDETANADTLMSKIGVPTLKRAVLNKKAIDLAQYLGTSYDWFDPRRWYEKDKEAFEVIKNVSQSDFDIIAKLYFEIYAKGHTLLSDLAKYLDTKYYSQLNFK